MLSLTPNINKKYLQSLFSKIFSNSNSPYHRPDGRSPKQYRKISITRLTSSFNSPINVCLGNTQIFSQINAKLVSPKIERPSEGIISFQVDTHHLKPSADFNSTNEALNEFRININTILEKCLKESHALDTNILCVIPGKIVFKIILEISIIKYDGNIYDASIIAALCSWLSFKIPFFRLKGGELYYDSFINLTTIHMPVCVTFGIFEKDDEKVEFVVDNTLEEDQVHHKGVHQPDANNIYISTGCCFKIMPIIFFIFGAVFSCMFLFAEGIGGIIGTVFGVIFVLISFCMMCKGYYSVYFTMGPNNLTVTKKALCGRSTRVYLPGELISVELTHDILPTRDGRTFNYQLNINTTNSGTDIAFRVGQSSPIFTMEEIGYFNFKITNFLHGKYRRALPNSKSHISTTISCINI